jgi:hypothetical protein
VLYARREILEAINGFPIGLRYDEAVGCELGISKRVEAIDLKTVAVGSRPFEYILHPQWKHLHDESAGPVWAIRKVTASWALRKALSKLKRRLLHRPRRLAGTIPGSGGGPRFDERDAPDLQRDVTGC